MRVSSFAFPAMLLVSAASIGCAGSRGATPAPSSPTATEPTTGPGTTEVAMPVPPPSFEVHEWGLLDVIASTGEAELASGPGRPTPLAPPTPPRPPSPEPPFPPMVRKPVLYVHPAPGTPAFDLAVEIELPGGRVLEHWPAGAVDEGELVFGRVRVDAGPCARTTIVPPGARTEPCGSADGYCEVDELASYRTTDGACLTVGSDASELLFYRGSYASVRLPLRIARLAGGRVALTNEGTSALPGRVVRLLATHDRQGALNVRMASAPSPGPAGRVELPTPTEAVDVAAARAALTAEAIALGLTADEARVFVDAWSDELFVRPSVREVVLHWLPADALDELAELRFSPPPTAVRRAMLVRAEFAD